MKKIENTEDALNLFEKYSISRAHALDEGNSRVANHNYDRIEEVIKYLREHKKLFRLSDFYNHPNTALRLSAAVYLLPVYETQSLKIMKEISKGIGITSHEAKMTIREWEKGNLHNFYTL